MNTDIFVDLFPKDDIPLILNTVLDCCSTLRKKSSNEHEVDISKRLTVCLKRNDQIDRGPFHVCLEYKLIDEAGQTHFIDINFLSSSGRSETYFAIEAKRLHVKRESLIGKYVGDGGMMCFVTGKYSSTQHASAMLGYVFDGKIEKARNSISAKIDEKREILKLAGKQGLVRSNIIKRRVDETRHRLEQRPFTIYHLLVPV